MMVSLGPNPHHPFLAMELQNEALRYLTTGSLQDRLADPLVLPYHTE
jgi:hypothetical protein